MKNVISIFLLSTLFAIACNKSSIEADITKQEKEKLRTSSEQLSFNGVDCQIQQGILQFPTFEHYTSLFDVKEISTLQEFANQVKNSSAMVSYVESITDDNMKSELEIIGSFVNSDGIIKIDAFTLLLDFEARKVFALQQGSINDLLDAKNGNVGNNVFSYSMDNADVIEELQSKKTRWSLCFERYAKNKIKYIDSPEFKTTVIASGIPATLQAIVRYSRSGIYCQLSTESYCPTWAAVGATIISRNVSWTYFFKERCGKSFSGTNSSTSHHTIGLTPNRAKHVIYAGPKTLKNYSLSATISSPISLIPGYSRTIQIVD